MMENVAYRCESTGRTVVVRIIRQDVSGIGDEGENWQEVGRQCVEWQPYELWPACPIEEA
jgi:hypothetical protein